MPHYQQALVVMPCKLKFTIVSDEELWNHQTLRIANAISRSRMTRYDLDRIRTGRADLHLTPF